ncbi:FHA domain-containing protein [Achromobacter xylosoxidans]
MLDIELNFPDAAPRRMSLPSPVLVGRAAPCGLRIAHWRVARRHAWLRAVETGVLLEDLDSLSGTLLNGARVERLAVRAAGGRYLHRAMPPAGVAWRGP